ncbi:BH0509 family protein [Rossellomorea vietnamensis]|nr:BH0509 family protein [Rossellomorea vietnamensis]
MNKQERENLIEWLVTATGYNRSYFDSMKDESIEKMYEEIVVRG